MSAYSHKYRIGRGNLVFTGELGMKEGQTFATTSEFSSVDNADDWKLNATQVTALNTFLTAVNTLNTAWNNIDNISIELNDSSTKGKLDLT